MTDSRNTKEGLASLMASICVSYGAITQKQADHMSINSFNKYPKKMFVETMLIGAEMHGYSAKIDEFREKLNDSRFDILFNEDVPEEEIVDEKDIPEGAVIVKEESDEDGNSMA